MEISCLLDSLITLINRQAVAKYFGFFTREEYIIQSMISICPPTTVGEFPRALAQGHRTLTPARARAPIYTHVCVIKQSFILYPRYRLLTSYTKTQPAVRPEDM